MFRCEFKHGALACYSWRPLSTATPAAMQKTPPSGATQRPACETLIRSPKLPEPSNRLERQSKWRNLGDEPRPSRGFDDPIAALGNAIGVFKLTTVLHAVGSHRQIARLLARSKGTTRGVEAHVQLVCKRTNRRANAMARCPTALFYQCQHMNVPITNYDTFLDMRHSSAAFWPPSNMLQNPEEREDDSRWRLPIDP